jgi:hypothetical protein
MAEDTPAPTLNLVIYEVFVRNHSLEGTFREVEKDLERIQSMGVDVIWLMPIHPIGKIDRKGSLGSPYSIADYRAINPEYGSLDDFKRLVDQAHRLNLKVWIDVVYNHTAHDSILVGEHPEWFHQDSNGIPITTVPEWSDVIDLKHPNPKLTDYLIETLIQWARLGVDGVRCDVASLLPLNFWIQARTRLAAVNPQITWLAESVHANFVAMRRFAGLSAISDSELYRAFDLTYDYDVWPIWQSVVTGRLPISRYMEMLRYQDCIYPANFVKMRCVENHDQPRVMAIAPSKEKALAWTAFQAFNKGAFLIYAGQEASAVHTPSLFDPDPVNWGNYSLQSYLTTLARLKKDNAIVNGKFILMEAEPAIFSVWYLPGQSLVGCFNPTGAAGNLDVKISDGIYKDLLTGKSVEVSNGSMTIPESAVIFRYDGPVPMEFFSSDLLNFSYSPQ